MQKIAVCLATSWYRQLSEPKAESSHKPWDFWYLKLWFKLDFEGTICAVV